MKIGIFTDTYYPQINGVSTSIRMLERELNKLGHTVFIFTTTDPNAPRPLARVFRMPSMPFVFLPTHRMALVYPPKLLLRMKRLKLDIVHTQTEFPVGIFGKLVAELCNIPMVHTYHTMYEDYTHYVANGHLISPAMAKRYSRIFCNRAKAVIAPAEKARDSLLEYGVKRPIHVIPTGIDLSKFYAGTEVAAEAELRSELGIDPGDKVVLFVGRIAREKSIDVLVAAFPELLKRLPGAKLLIVGGGPAEESLKKQAADLGVGGAVIFGGPKPWDSIGKYYRLGDVFVTASTSETQGLTYIEAMASGRPVVAKKDSSIQDVIIHGETGYLFERDSELAQLLYYVLANPKEARSVADNGFNSVCHLSSAEFARKVAALYDDVLQNYRPRRRLNVWRRLKRGVAFTGLGRPSDKITEREG